MSVPSVDYQCVLRDLKARRDRLNAAIEAVEQIIGELQPGAGASSQAGIPLLPTGRNGSDIYRKMTIKDAVIHVLRSSGGKKPTTDIVQALKEGGVRSKSKNLYTTVYNTLTSAAEKENGLIVRVEKDWALREIPQS